MDPRFKAKSVRHTTWERLQEAAVATNDTEADARSLIPMRTATQPRRLYENPRGDQSCTTTQD